jgi:hypothetical protein
MISLRASDASCSKDLHKGYNFASYFILIEGLHTKLWGPKVAKIPTMGISGLPARNPRTKSHLDVGLMAMHKVYYKGEVVASPKSKLWWILRVPICPWLVCASKCSNYALTNLLFGLCKSVWVIGLLVNLPSPHPEASFLIIYHPSFIMH